MVSDDGILNTQRVNIIIQQYTHVG